jgi:IPT/TIG domain
MADPIAPVAPATPPVAPVPPVPVKPVVPAPAAPVVAPPPVPAVTSMTPATGPTSGGTVVAVAGSNLTGATEVKFGTSPAEFTVNSPTSMIATSPPGAQVVDVIVVTPAGLSVPGAKFTYTGTPVVVATCTEAPPVGSVGAVIPKVGVVLIMPPAKYGLKLHGYLSVVLPVEAAINDVVEMYAVSGRDHSGVLVSVFPPVGESINSHPASDGTNGDAASSVASNSGRMFRKVSATNWQSLGGGND